MAINERLQRLFDTMRASYAVLPHDDAYSAEKVAQSVRVEPSRFAKVVVIRAEDGHDFMIVLPATHHLDPRVFAQRTGQAGFRLEDEAELARLFPDCEVGAMPPFGALYDMTMFVDPCLLRDDDIFFQAGNHHEVVLMRREEFELIADPFYAGCCLHGREDDRPGPPHVRRAHLAATP